MVIGLPVKSISDQLVGLGLKNVLSVGAGVPKLDLAATVSRSAVAGSMSPEQRATIVL